MVGKAREMERLRQLQDDPKMLLTEAEKYNVELLLQKQQELQQQLNKVAIALSGFISQTVSARGLNPKSWGVNLAAGRILPISPPSLMVPKDGEQPAVEEKGN